MRKFSLFMAAFIVLCGLSTVSFAQMRQHQVRKNKNHPGQNINARQRKQQNRIVNGLNHGKLTMGESRRIAKREARLTRKENRFRKSGNGLSMGERRRLNRGLNRNSRVIFKQKHDKQHPHPNHTGKKYMTIKQSD